MEFVYIIEGIVLEFLGLCFLRIILKREVNSVNCIFYCCSYFLGFNWYCLYFLCSFFFRVFLFLVNVFIGFDDFINR